MEKEKTITDWHITVISTIIIVLAIMIVLMITNNKVETIDEEDAKFIGNNSVLYVQLGCHACKNQEDLFGENIKYLKIIDCFEEENTQECIKLGIDVIPTWIINGEKYPGFKTELELKEIINGKSN